MTFSPESVLDGVLPVRANDTASTTTKATPSRGANRVHLSSIELPPRVSHGNEPAARRCPAGEDSPSALAATDLAKTGHGPTAPETRPTGTISWRLSSGGPARRSSAGPPEVIHAVDPRPLLAARPRRPGHRRQPRHRPRHQHRP